VPARRQSGPTLYLIDLEAGRPPVHQALANLERELALAKQEGRILLKLIHGYGSSGAGGDIRIAVQNRLRELERNGSIQFCIFGEDWGPSDANAWKLLKAYPALKNDPHLGRHNRGITVVLL
jgi:hypothetical protein